MLARRFFCRLGTTRLLAAPHTFRVALGMRSSFALGPLHVLLLLCIARCGGSRRLLDLAGLGKGTRLLVVFFGGVVIALALNSGFARIGFHDISPVRTTCPANARHDRPQHDNRFRSEMESAGACRRSVDE